MSRPLAEVEMGWIEPKFSQVDVDWAGEQLRQGFPENQRDLLRTFEILHNWRSAHNYPLNTFQTTLRTKAAAVSRGAIIAQRSKRLSSIEAKLRRFDWITLSEMQDLGGCRAIVASVPSVHALVASYKGSRIQHVLCDEDDYISMPKPSGYRGVHLIYQYKASRKSAYNGLKIEMQLRSKLQHAWATAVETVDTFARQTLKAGGGQDDWRRFFKLMSTEIARREKTPAVPGTSSNRSELVGELRHLAEMLNVEMRLTAYNATVQRVGTESAKGARYFLMELDPDKRLLTVRPFQSKQMLLAEDSLAAAERDVAKNPTWDAVLVSVDSMAALRRAYPNYYLDTTAFLAAVRLAIA